MFRDPSFLRCHVLACFELIESKYEDVNFTFLGFFRNFVLLLLMLSPSFISKSYSVERISSP